MLNCGAVCGTGCAAVEVVEVVDIASAVAAMVARKVLESRSEPSAVGTIGTRVAIELLLMVLPQLASASIFITDEFEATVPG